MDDPYGIVLETRLLVFGAGIWAGLFYILSAILRPYLTKSDFQFPMLIDICFIVVAFIQTLRPTILDLRDLRHRTRAVRNQPLMKFTQEQFNEQCVLKSGPLYDPFKAHLESEFSYEALAFIESATLWGLTYYDVGPKTARSRAKRIANMFIGERAELPCNLSAAISSNILAQLSSANESHEVSPDLFHDATVEIKQMLYRDAFTRFLRSETFERAQASITPDGITLVAASNLA